MRSHLETRIARLETKRARPFSFLSDAELTTLIAGQWEVIGNEEGEAVAVAAGWAGDDLAWLKSEIEAARAEAAV